MPVQASSPDRSGPVGIVVGLEAEARIARLLHGRIAVGGGDREGAQSATEALAKTNIRALLSFGLAGGIAPDLAPGALLIPDRILSGGREFLCDPQLRAQISASAKGDILTAPVYGGGMIVAQAEAKAALYERTGAVAVDLESGAVAQVAQHLGLPFAALRVVCDPAERTLPPAAMIALNQAGKIGLLRVMASVLRHPGQIPDLIRLGNDARLARQTLLTHVRQIGAVGG